MWFIGPPDVEKLRIRGKIKGLIKLLEDDDPEIREAAAEALGDFDEVEVIEALIEALKDKKKEVRWRAAKSLESLCRDSTEKLIETFSESYSTLQKISIAWILSRLRDRKAVNALIDGLKDEDRYVRRASAMALGRICDERAIYPLIEALKDFDKDVRRRAVESLYRIGKKDEIGDRSKMRKVIIKALVGALNDPESDVRGEAAKALEKLGWRPKSEKELAMYLTALRKGSELVIIGEEAVEPLLIALRDEDWNVKKFASEILSEIKTDKCIEKLAEVLKDDNWEVRKHAAYALGRMGREECIKYLIPLLADEDPNVREEARYAIMQYGEKAIKYLEEASQKDPRLMEEANFILEKIKKR
jgi:HEAT repeat protein